MTAIVVPLNSSQADTLTAEEQALVDKGAVMEMYKPDEHSRHFIAHIDSVTDPKTKKRATYPTIHRPWCVLFLGWRTQNLREKRDEVWRSVTIVHPKRTNFFLHKDGTSITTDFSPGVMFRRVRPRMIKQ